MQRERNDKKSPSRNWGGEPKTKQTEVKNMIIEI